LRISKTSHPNVHDANGRRGNPYSQSKNIILLVCFQTIYVSCFLICIHSSPEFPFLYLLSLFFCMVWLFPLVAFGKIYCSLMLTKRNFHLWFGFKIWFKCKNSQETQTRTRCLSTTCHSWDKEQTKSLKLKWKKWIV
jgi:hypothetical protein